MRQVVGDDCEILCEDNGRKMVADILYFKEYQNLTVSIEKQLKLEMKWNGNIYEGRLGRMSFTSEGPVIRNFKQGRR
jgi:hypothetical protein